MSKSFSQFSIFAITETAISGHGAMRKISSIFACDHLHVLLSSKIWHKYIMCVELLLVPDCLFKTGIPIKLPLNPSSAFLTFPSTILCLIHSFSGDVSTDTESMQRWRQKFLAPNQSSSLPASNKEKFNKSDRQVSATFFHAPWVLWSLQLNQYPFPSGLLSWITRCAHRAGFGGSRILPFGNCAMLSPMTDTITINTFIFFF